MNTRAVTTAALLLTAITGQAQLFQNLSSLADRIPVGSGSSNTSPYGRMDGPKWLCTADFDGDGHADMATTHINGELSVVWGFGNKRFTSPLVLSSGVKTLRGIACADFNADGKPDLVAAAPDEGKLVIWRNNGSRQFAAPTTVNTFRGARNLTIGNFDGDAYPDIAVAGPDMRPGTTAQLPPGVVLPPAQPPVPPPPAATTGLMQFKGAADGSLTHVATVPEVASEAEQYFPYRPLYTVRAFRVPGETIDRLAVTHANSRVVWSLKPTGGLLSLESSVEITPPQAEVGGGVRAIQVGSVTAQTGACDLLTANSDAGTIEVRSRLPGGSAFAWQSAIAQTLHVPFGPRSMELNDLDRDGWLDLVVAVRNADRIIVFKNKNGTLEQSSSTTSGRSPREMAAGDFNEDGYTDFAVVNRQSYDISILAGGPPRTDGIVSFAALDQIYAVDGEPAALTIKPLNNDAREDVIQLHRASGEVSVRLSGPGGRLGAPVFYPMGTRPNALSVVDYDRDGKLDLVTANLGANATAGASGFRKGLGNGSFGPYTEASINNELALLGIPESQSGSLYGIEYGDLDNDGIKDAVAGFIDCRILFYKGLSDGTFRLVTSGSGLDHIFYDFIFEARGFAIADFDQDGDNDIAAVGVYGELGTVENKGDLLSVNRGPLTIRKAGLLQQISNSDWTGASHSLIVRDINNDGDPDLLAGLRLGSVAFMGQPGMGFAVGQLWTASVPPPRDFSAPVVNFPVSSMAEGDYDNNGVRDLAIACDVARCIEIQVRNGFNGWDRSIRVAVPSAAFLASGDIDGDGKADLAGTGEVLWVALSSRPADAGPPLTQNFTRQTITHPVINEIMAQNQSVAVTAPNFTIEAGDNPDYIEIFHGGTGLQNFSGWKLSLEGASGTVRQFTFPTTADLKSKGLLVVRCSPQPDGGTPDPWRTGWGLPEGGGTLHLTDAAGNLVDTVVYPKQLKDVSYGRYQDGLDNFVFNGLPDPGRSNVDNGPLAPRIDFDGFKASTYGPGQNTLFRCECRDDTAPIACSIVYWRTDIADQTRRRVLLYDDGMHEDGGMLDSAWAGRLSAPLPLGAQISFYIEATDLNETIAYAPVDPNSPADDDTAAAGFFRLAITTPMPSLEISEVMTRNKQVILNGGTPDYFEIRNTGLTPADLTGVSIAGKLFEDAPRYTFPNGHTLPPGGTVLVFPTGGAGEFTAPFKLDPAGGSFYLLRSPADPVTQGNGFIDSVVIPELAKSEAWFRMGADGPWTKGLATPGFANVPPGEIMLREATGEFGEPVMTIAIPTVIGTPWHIQNSANLLQWSTLRSGTGNGIEQAVTLPATDTRNFFRATP